MAVRFIDSLLLSWMIICCSGLNINLSNMSSLAIVDSLYTLKCEISDTETVVGDVTFFRGIRAMCHVKHTVAGCIKKVSHFPGYRCDCAKKSNGRQAFLLNILKVRKEDRIRWGCYYHHTTSNFILIAVKYPPSITNFKINSLNTAILDEGEQVTLRCDVSSNPVSKIQIVKDSKKKSRQTESGSVTWNWTSAECLDSGYYTCQAHNGVSSPQNRTAKVIVRCSPRLDVRVENKYTIVSSVHSNITLSVFTIANPIPSFKWFKLHRQRKEFLYASKPSVSTMSTAIGKYVIVNADINDGGTYQLLVNNSAPGPPLIVKFKVVVQGEFDGSTDLRDEHSENEFIQLGIVTAVVNVVVLCFVFFIVYYLRRLRSSHKEEREQSIHSYEYINPDDIELLRIPEPVVETNQSEAGYDTFGATQMLHQYDTISP